MDATDKLTVTLEAQQWNTVMALLAEGPFRLAAPLIGEIKAQCEAAEAANKAPGPENAQRMKPALNVLKTEAE